MTWCFGHMYEQAEPDVYTPDNVPRNESGKKSGEKMICQLSRKSGLLTLVKMLRNS
nr:DNA topoisomerase III [Salmonella enterica subsp. enterica serovar Rissen]